jgi:hypothetical protein
MASGPCICRLVGSQAGGAAISNHMGRDVRQSTATARSVNTGADRGGRQHGAPSDELIQLHKLYYN